MAKKTAAPAGAAAPASAPDKTAAAPAPSTKQPAAPAKKDPSTSTLSSSSSLLFIIVPLLVALIGGAWTTLGPQFVDTAVTSPLARELRANASTANASTVAPALGDARVVDKYTSELVHITTQKLLTPTPKPDVNCPVFAGDGDLAHVETVLGRATDLKQANRVFLMLNGQNEGVSIRWTPQDACLHELAMFAALTLGTDADILTNGVKLMTQDGRALTTVEQLDTLRIAHVLFDFQIWVWPGIKVGHEFTVEGCKVKTASLRPKVFTVEGFFTQDEATEIMRQGIDRLSRSPVDSPEAVDGYHADRTSYTAFLNDNAFTRNFRVRTAALARLPSPSFTERLQLVRYEKGQFFRKHEDYFDSKQFIPKQSLASSEYETWATWAASTLETLVASGRDDVPDAFRPGGQAFPDFADKGAFQHYLLGAFLEDADATDFFVEHADVEWGNWIRSNVANRAHDVVGPLLKDKGYMLAHIIKSWEKRAGLSELRYKIPKRPVSGVSHYFRWVRWAKERVQDLLDSDDASVVPLAVRPEGPDYPTYNIRFQNRLIKYVLEDTTKDELVAAFSAEWYDWLVKNQRAKDVLIEALRSTTKIFELAVKSWTKRAGDAFAYTTPTHLHHFEPNRFVTVFMYLNDCPEGGETVFPYSEERLVTGIKREGMDECSEGLAVPPTKLFASMFYSQTPMNDVDPSSLHGGCPPHEGVKYGSNSFAWNADADEGANAWDLGEDFKTDASIDYDDTDVEALVKDNEEEASDDAATDTAAVEAADDSSVETETESVDAVAE